MEKLDLTELSQKMDRNEVRRVYVENSFGPLFESKYQTFEHGIWGTGLQSQLNYLESFLNHINLGEVVFPNFTGLLMNVPFKLNKGQYDFLRENADLNKLAACLKLKNEIYPFYGRVFAIIELCKVLFKGHQIDSIPLGHCYASPFLVYDIFELFSERNFEGVLLSDDRNGSFLKVLMKQCFLRGITNKDQLLQVFFSAQKRLLDFQKFDVEGQHETGVSAIYSTGYLLEDCTNHWNISSAWLPSGYAPLLQVIREDDNILFYVTTENQIKDITLENLASETKGNININAYYLLTQKGIENNLSFDEIMKQLLIERED